MRRLVLLLTLFLIWPLTVCAQMVSPGGGTNIYGNVAIVGGTCQAPMSMNGIDQVGNISCQAPATSTGPTAPTNPVNGQQWFDTTNNTLNIWNGTAWVPVSGTGGSFTPPDGSTWTATGLTGLASLGVNGNTTLGGNLIVSGSTNLVGPLTFNGVPMGGTCAVGEFVSALSATGVPTCSPWVGGGPAVGPTPPLNPFAGDLWVNTSAPVPTLEVWDGVAWVVVSNPSAANTSPTPPPSPIVGQIWYNSTTNPATMEIWDGSAWVVVGSEWAPLTNPPGGANNYAAINITSPTEPPNPSTGQLWFNTTDLQTYIWYTDPTSSQWVPIVNIGGGGGGSGSIIDSPTFTGTLTFPDGSYYDTNGHEVMKNLGVGVVAYSDGANAGGGTVYGNSITVVNSGWDSVAAPNGYWDEFGLEQMFGVNAQDWFAPAIPNGFAEALVQADVDNNANGNPWGQYTFQNMSAPPTPDSGNTQTWQPEGLEFINAIGIHGDTWGWNAIPDCTATDINGASLSDCAIAAMPSSLYNNLNYKIWLSNSSTGDAAQASYILENNAPHTGGMYLTGTGFTPAAGAQPDQLDINTNAANGIAFTIGYSTSVAQITSTGMNVNGALTVNGAAIGPVLQTWTPTFGAFAGTAPTVTYTHQRGIYYVQGNVVTFSFWVQWSGFVMGTGIPNLSLPASQSNNPNALGGVSCSEWENINLGLNQTYLGAYINPGNAYVNFAASGNNQTGSAEPVWNNGVGYVACQGWLNTGST